MPTVTGSITKQPIFPGATSVGLNHVGAYQASGTPWMTGSILLADTLSGSIKTFHFPRVAKSITIQSVPNCNFVYGGKTTTDPIFIFFGEPKTGAGTVRAGNNDFNVDSSSPKYLADATAPPLQYSQAHAYIISYMSGANPANADASFTTTVKTDHITVGTIGIVDGTAKAAIASFQIFAELTNIPAARMPANYISGSGVNTL